MKHLLFISIFIFANLSLFSQEATFRVEVSTDSILIGNYFEVRFTIENAAGDFEAPEFDGFDVLVGPNTSSSFSMINGKVTQQASYSYMIRPVREGLLYIEPAYFKSGETVLETEPIQIGVHPNPGGIEDNKTFIEGQHNPFFNPGPKKEKGPKFKHKKRKI